MKIIIGLGNPGEKYKNTRHNIGFMFLDFLKDKLDLQDFYLEKKFDAKISTGNLKSEKIILLKPETFMNLSGQAVNKIINFYKIDKKNIIVIYDDLSMDFGKVRNRQNGSHGGHNGIKDIINYIGQDFNRFKIGIGLDKRYDVSNWVLSKFKKEELGKIDSNIFPKVYNGLLDFL